MLVNKAGVRLNRASILLHSIPTVKKHRANRLNLLQNRCSNRRRGVRDERRNGAAAARRFRAGGSVPLCSSQTLFQCKELLHG